MDLEHLFCNMVCLYNFGSRIEYHFGGKFLLKLYLAGALGGSIFYLVHHSFMAPISKGASGAVNAIMLLYIFLNPKAVFHYNFIIPIPGFLLVCFLFTMKLNIRILNPVHPCFLTKYFLFNQSGSTLNRT
ncbi:rhomboid protease [Ranunculus cassubicifolius]